MFWSTHGTLFGCGMISIGFGHGRCADRDAARPQSHSKLDLTWLSLFRLSYKVRKGDSMKVVHVEERKIKTEDAFIDMANLGTAP